MSPEMETPSTDHAAAVERQDAHSGRRLSKAEMLVLQAIETHGGQVSVALLEQDSELIDELGRGLDAETFVAAMSVRSQVLYDEATGMVRPAFQTDESPSRRARFLIPPAPDPESAVLVDYEVPGQGFIDLLDQARERRQAIAGEEGLD